MPAWRNILRAHGSSKPRRNVKPSWWTNPMIGFIDARLEGLSRPVGWLIQRMRCADEGIYSERRNIGSHIAYERFVPTVYREDNPEGLSEDGLWYYSYSEENTLW